VTLHHHFSLQHIVIVIKTGKNSRKDGKIGVGLAAHKHININNILIA